MTELVRKIASPQTTVYRAVPKLKELGLINDKLTPYPVKRIFSLTEKGRKVAEKLAEVESILQSE